MTEPPGDRVRSQALTEQAALLREEGRWREALAVAFEALRLDRGNPVAAHNLGVLLSKMGRLKEAEAAIRHALVLAPDTSRIIHSLAHILLAQGRLREGWAIYKVRELIPETKRAFPADFPFPRWRGEPLAGKRIAVFPEQGLGDQIQFARFLPRLIAQADAVTLLTLPPLERLFRHNFPGADIVAASGAAEFPDPDYWITLQDLPGMLDVGLDTIPAEPYLRPPGSWPSLGPGFKIGLKTKGNPKHSNDRQRSLAEEYAAQLRAGLPGQLVSLEPEDSRTKDMADTAAIVEQLDLIVSVDTSVAHLAGAMGKPCLLLVPGFAPDWRWMVGRDDSPWYPRHKLFRGDVDRGWQGAVDRLVAEAQARASGPHIRPEAKGDSALAALMLRAKALRDQARYSQALDLMRQAVRKAPENPAAPNILGTMLRDVGRLDEAERFQRRALALQSDYPAFRYDLGVTLLAQGRYAEAWPLYQARSDIPSLRIGFPKGLEAPRWRGEDPAGKRLAILPEQGLGDTIQFARFLPWLGGRGARVRLYVQPSLVDLLRASFPDLEILPAQGSVQLGRPDYWTTLVDMAGPLGVALETLPSSPYLRTDRRWPDREPGFAIGIQTRGSARHTNDARRSLPSDAADTLRARLPGQVVDLDPERSGARDFADTAALIQQLDLVVSVDTSVAHLAGALGKPCLLLVPSLATDWRWMRGRDDSPWYPRHRLFRGAMDGGWDAAIETVAAEAQRLHAAA